MYVCVCVSMFLHYLQTDMCLCVCLYVGAEKHRCATTMQMKYLLSNQTSNNISH